MLRGARPILIYISQLSHISDGVYQNNVFPLAIGFIGAYLKKELKDRVEVELFKSPVELNEAILRQPPDVLMFSHYMWNHNLNLAFIKEARKQFEDMLIIVGGPNISLDSYQRRKFMKENPEIDIYVLYEGEVVTKELIAQYLKTRNRDELRKWEHPSILTNGMREDTPTVKGTANRANRIGIKGASTSLDDIPSPYLTGMFDKFFIDGERPLIETNRGCPFTCTFCQQGEDYYMKVVHFSEERVRDEIMYIADKIQREKIKTYAIEIADPNFGMFERDRIVCAAIREAQDKTNFPQYVGCSTGKNKAETIIENTSLLKLGSIQLRSAMQSMDPEVLDSIKRQNIKLETYHKIQKAMDERGLENTADMMLGLPLETQWTHARGIFDLIDAGVKDFSCLQTIILKGTTMEKKDYREKYGLKTKYRYIPECAGEYDILRHKRKVSEVEGIIIETNTMPFADYLASRKLHFLTVLLHNSRLLMLVYKLLDNLGIKKSEVLRHMWTTENSELQGLIKNFLEDTKREVFDIDQKIDFDYGVDQAISHNKIFKHVAIALFQHKNAVIHALKQTLKDLLDSDYVSAIDELMEILSAGVISPFEEISDHTFEIKSEKLKSVFGARIELKLSEKQEAIITVLNSLYQRPEDKINRLLYRLRPENILLKVNFAGESEKNSEVGQAVFA